MDKTDEALLQEILQSENYDEDESEAVVPRSVAHGPETTAEPGSEPKKSAETHTQWALGGNGRYMPIGQTEAKLPAGVYETFAAPGMWGVEKLSMASDGIYLLPDMATQTVLNEVKTFWAREDRYRAHDLLYKRGILLFGPPGGGKTVAVKLLMDEIVKQDGIVLIISSVSLAIIVLKALRRIEPKRNIIVVFEDIDEIINYNGEANVLSMLDGENNVDNILHIATTNYPDRLGARIINRPSRFDRVINIGMPTDAARRSYLEQATKGGLDPADLDKWVSDTNGLSVAHLRELVVAVYCLDQPYAEVVQRLKDMGVPKKGDDGFKKAKKLGYAADSNY